MTHEDNVIIIKAFLCERYQDAWNPREVSAETGISVKTVKGILRRLFRKNVVNKRLAKIHFVKVNNARVIRKNPDIKVYQKETVNPVAYYYWNKRNSNDQTKHT